MFSVGVTSLPKYYAKEKLGLVNGIYGMGNIGTAITTFVAPVIATQIGWSRTVQLYLVLPLIFAVLNVILGDRKEIKVKTPIMEQIKGVYKMKNCGSSHFLFYYIRFVRSLYGVFAELSGYPFRACEGGCRDADGRVHLGSNNITPCRRLACR